jgi:hypothetical protein
MYICVHLKLKNLEKSLFILLAVISTVIASCSKDAKINRRIDGEWKVVSIAGASIPSDESYTWKFSKDEKLTGDGTYTEVDSFGTYSIPFTYTVGSEKITLVIDGFAEILTVSKYEKKKLELIDSDNDVWVLDPK